MKIIISQTDLPAGRQGKKLLVTFKLGKIVDKYTIDKADDFLAALDKFFEKHHTTGIDGFKNVKLEFHNTGLLTERVIRSIIGGFEVDT